MRSRTLLGAAGLLAGGIAIGGVAVSQTAAPQPPSPSTDSTAAREARGDIERSLGQVPGMFRFFPDSGIAGAWAEFRDLQMGRTVLPGKVKELIGLAVAAQIPCGYCVHFHTRAARLNGATEDEIREAVGMAAMTRHWSTVLNGSAQDPAEFRREADAIFSRLEAAAATGADPQQQQQQR
ncbi:MAG: carboxymuconolactone decarboxylase family protein [Acetobacteraceae bacterium]|nr:carboxymuconolactone decarboxylase family protein [Acetobacteraceae bacterium]